MTLSTLYRIQFNQFALFLLLLKKRLTSTKNELTQKTFNQRRFFSRRKKTYKEQVTANTTAGKYIHNDVIMLKTKKTEQSNCY